MNRKQNSDVRGRRSEIGGQRKKEEGRWTREDGRRKTEDGGRKAEDGRRRAAVRGGKRQQFDIKIKDTFDLIKKIQNNELPDKIMINVHPQRWNDEFVPWARELVWQNVKNVVKKMLVRRTDDGRRRTEDVERMEG